MKREESDNNFWDEEGNRADKVGRGMKENKTVRKRKEVSKKCCDEEGKRSELLRKRKV